MSSWESQSRRVSLKVVTATSGEEKMGHYAGYSSHFYVRSQGAFRTSFALLTLAATSALAAVPLVGQERVELEANGDADVQSDTSHNSGSAPALHVGHPDKTVFVHFDLSAIPEGATIERAELIMTAYGAGYTGINQVAVGAALQRWQEMQVTAQNQPNVTMSQRVASVSGVGPVQWNVKPAVEAWVSGAQKNYGFALRGDGPIWAFMSRENADTGGRPTLRVEYTAAADGGGGNDNAPTFRTRVNAPTHPVQYGSTVPYEVQLIHNGDVPRQVQIRDVLPSWLHTHTGVDVQTQGGVVGGNGSVVPGNAPAGQEEVVRWQGTMNPGARVTMTFDVHVTPPCGRDERRTPITNTAQARSPNLDPITATSQYDVACPGYRGPLISTDPVEAPTGNPGQLEAPRFRVTNGHEVPVILGFLDTSGNITERVELGAGEGKEVSLIRGVAPNQKEVDFCFLTEPDERACPDRSKAGHLFGKATVRAGRR